MSNDTRVELCGMCMFFIFVTRSCVFFMHVFVLMRMTLSMCLSNLCASRAFV
jgi:hypothetical protein